MATQEVIEEVAEVVDDAIEAVERIPTANLNGTNKRQQIIILGVTAALSAAAGGGVAWLFANKKLSAKYEEILKRELEESRKFYERYYKAGEDFDSPQAVLASEHGVEAVLALDTYQGKTAESPSGSEEELEVKEQVTVKEDELGVNVKREAQVETRNVFEQAEADQADSEDDRYDAKFELMKREHELPYILTEEQYLQNPDDYDQHSLTYFEEDGVLADEKDKMIRNVDDLVGEDHLDQFGIGTKDPNTLYIGNEKLKLYFEITKSKGSFSKEVHGFDDSLEHSDKRSGLRRFRHDDG